MIPLPQNETKSWVRVKAFVLLAVAVLGIMQAIEITPWAPSKPIEVGGFLLLMGLVLPMLLRCEKCGTSPADAVMALGQYEIDERKSKRRELMAKGNRLAAYRKRCIHCGKLRH